MAEKKVILGIMGFSAIGGGIMLLRGKGPGGALVVAGFALNYIAENQSTFISDIFKTFGFVSAIILSYIDLWAEKFKILGMMFNEAIKGNFKGMNELGKQLYSTPEDYMRHFKNAYKDTKMTGSFLQAQYNDWVADIDTEIKASKVNDPSTSKAEVKNILIQEVNINGLQGQGFEEIIEQIYKNANRAG
jgi:hypothetical protein